MDRAVFAEHFVAAAKVARDFARRYLEEPLLDEMIFRVHLNSSYDVNAGADVKLFPRIHRTTERWPPSSSTARARLKRKLDL